MSTDVVARRTTDPGWMHENRLDPDRDPWGSHFFWLVLVPLISALIPWILSGPINTLTVVVRTVCPVVGAVVAAVYVSRRAGPLGLLPLVPFAAAALGHLAGLVHLHAFEDGYGPDTTMDFVMVWSFMALPLTAILGGGLARRLLCRRSTTPMPDAARSLD